MKCPTCKSSLLGHGEMEAGLPARTCPTCAGSFVAFDDFLKWQEGAGDSAAAAAVPKPAAESIGPKLCPFCGRFLTRFRVALDIPFQIDRCGLCAGIWLNAGEWEYLRSRGVAKRLNHVFADAWQNQMRAEETRRNQEERYRSLLGDADFETARVFKRWLEAHAKRTTVWAFLENKDVP